MLFGLITEEPKRGEHEFRLSVDKQSGTLWNHRLIGLSEGERSQGGDCIENVENSICIESSTQDDDP